MGIISSLFFMIFYLAVLVFFIVLFIKMYCHVKALRRKADNSSAFHYLEKAKKLRATVTANTLTPEDRTSYLQACKRNLNIALYLFGQGQTGEIPLHFRTEYSGDSDFGSYIEDYLRKSINEVDSLLQNTEKEDSAV